VLTKKQSVTSYNSVQNCLLKEMQARDADLRRTQLLLACSRKGQGAGSHQLSQHRSCLKL